MIGAHPQREWDELLTRVAVTCIALARGQRVLARAYLEMDVEKARRWLVAEQGYEGTSLD